MSTTFQISTTDDASVTPPGGTGVCVVMKLEASGGSDRTWATVAGPVTPPADNLRLTKTSGGTMITYISAPLTADVYVSTAPYASAYGRENNAAANLTYYFRVAKLDSGGTYTWFATGRNSTELGTTNATRNLTLTLGAATTFVAGDRLAYEIHFDDAATNMASGYFGYVQQGSILIYEDMIVHGSRNGRMLLGCGW